MLFMSYYTKNKANDNPDFREGSEVCGARPLGETDCVPLLTLYLTFFSTTLQRYGILTMSCRKRVPLIVQIIDTAVLTLLIISLL